MDAKPQRPIRTVRVRADENVPPAVAGNKTLHQRNKSSPALSTMYSYQAGGLKAAAKRTAFGEVTNVANYLRPSRDDSAIPSKTGHAVFDKAGFLIENKKPAALSRPAQRPLSISGLKGILASVSDANYVSTSEVANTRKTLTKKNTTVYKDTSAVSNGLDIELIRRQANQAPLSIASLNLPVAAELQVPSLEQVDPPKPRERKRLSRYASTFERLEAEKEARKVSPPVQDRRVDAFNDEQFAQMAPYIPEAKRNSIALRRELRKALSDDSISARTAQQVVIEAPGDDEFIHGILDEDYDDGYVTAQSYKSRGDNTTGAVTTEVVPQMTSKTKREVEAATKLVEASRTLEEIEEETWDTSMVAEYGEDIFHYMRELETKMAPNPNYMESQAEIQWSMRAVLMDWLVQVHHRFGLLPETLFLCSNFIDRFLSCKVVSLGKLQLVGATALFIAAKYEEINCPSVQEIVYMVDSGYTVEEILKAERFMLSMLQFELGWPGPMSFLRRISKADDYDLETRTLAKYFLEITVLDERFVGSPPSFLAAGAHCLARQMLKKGTWTPNHVHYSGYTYSQLEFLISLLIECCENPEKHHSAVYEKYSDKRFKRASVFVAAEVKRGFQQLDHAADASGNIDVTAPLPDEDGDESETWLACGEGSEEQPVVVE